MTLRPWVFAIAPLFASATAFAQQAPGETAPEFAQPPGETPVVTPPDPIYGIDVMAHRWAVGVGLGAFAVTTENAPEGSELKFRNSELDIRYRASRRFELELAITGGRQVLEHDEEGPLANGTVIVGARYRFMPEKKWNWWLGGGLGGTIIANYESSKEERESAQRPLAVFDIGLERRFHRFAIQAQIRSYAIGPTKGSEEKAIPVDGGEAPPQPTDPGKPEPAKLPPDGGYGFLPASEELTGASFTIGLSYYF